MIKIMYDDFQCSVLHNGKESLWFKIITGVKQGCLLSPILFVIMIDFVMRRSMMPGRGIGWIGDSQLDDLDYADDLALLAPELEDLQEKTSRLNEEAKKMGLKINMKKTEIMRMNMGNEDPIQVEGQGLKNVEKFTYLGNIIDSAGGAVADVNNRLMKARGSFQNLREI